MGFLSGLDSKESVCSVGDLGSTPGLERSPWGKHGNPPQYSFLENLMDRGAWRATDVGSQKVGHNWATVHSTSHYLSLTYWVHLANVLDPADLSIQLE